MWILWIRSEGRMKDVAYWKKEIEDMHPSEYIDLLQAIQDRHYMLLLLQQKIRT